MNSAWFLNGGDLGAKNLSTEEKTKKKRAWFSEKDVYGQWQKSIEKAQD